MASIVVLPHSVLSSQHLLGSDRATNPVQFKMCSPHTHTQPRARSHNFFVALRMHEGSREADKRESGMEHIIMLHVCDGHASECLYYSLTHYINRFGSAANRALIAIFILLNRSTRTHRFVFKCFRWLLDNDACFHAIFEMLDVRLWKKSWCVWWAHVKLAVRSGHRCYIKALLSRISSDSTHWHSHRDDKAKLEQTLYCILFSVLLWCYVAMKIERIFICECVGHINDLFMPEAT